MFWQFGRKAEGKAKREVETEGFEPRPSTAVKIVDNFKSGYFEILSFASVYFEVNKCTSRIGIRWIKITSRGKSTLQGRVSIKMFQTSDFRRRSETSGGADAKTFLIAKNG